MRISTWLYDEGLNNPKKYWYAALVKRLRMALAVGRERVMKQLP